MPGFKTDKTYPQATTTVVEGQHGSFNVASVYNPLKHKIDHTMFSAFFAGSLREEIGTLNIAIGILAW